MNRKLLGVAAGLAILTLGACGGTSTSGNATTSPAPSPKASASAAVTPAAVDPCQVVTMSEASQLAGANYATSKEDTTAGGSKICWYGAQTTNVFEVLVATAPSASAAQAAWDQEKSQAAAELQQAAAAGVSINFNISDTNLSGADRAAVGTFSGTISGQTIAGTALYFIKGVNFVAIVDLVLNKTPPTAAAMEAQGQTSLGRLP